MDKCITCSEYPGGVSWRCDCTLPKPAEAKAEHVGEKTLRRRYGRPPEPTPVPQGIEWATEHTCERVTPAPPVKVRSGTFTVQHNPGVAVLIRQDDDLVDLSEAEARALLAELQRVLDEGKCVICRHAPIENCRVCSGEAGKRGSDE